MTKQEKKRLDGIEAMIACTMSPRICPPILGGHIHQVFNKVPPANRAQRHGRLELRGAMAL